MVKIDWKGIIIGGIIGIIIIGLFAGLLFINDPYTRFWLEQEEKEWQWCITNKPIFNISHDLSGNPTKAEPCFSKYWDKYCKELTNCMYKATIDINCHDLCGEK